MQCQQSVEHCPTHPQTPVTFDAVVVKCFGHGGQSLLPCVTIGDQLEETDQETLASHHHCHVISALQ